jgi:CYTH domain-containing protein
MNRKRVFLVAAPLARLIRRDVGIISRRVEGYFPAQADRMHFIRIEPNATHLVLVEGPAAEENTVENTVEVPKSQALVLLDVSAGRIGAERSILRLTTGHEVRLDRIAVGDARVDLASVVQDGDAGAFGAQAWFGPEVTDDPQFHPMALALEGVPPSTGTKVTEAGLDSLLDLLESRCQVSDISAGASSAVRHVVELDRFAMQARRAGT